MKKTKFLALVLSLLMIICALPITALAASVAIADVEATVTAPVDGATPDASPVTAGEHYQAGDVRWFTGGTPQSPTDQMNATDKFEAGKTYIAVVDFLADPGYIFEPTLSAKINGKDATLVLGSVSNFGVTFTVPYPQKTVEIPFKKVVALGGNTAPAKQAFDLEIFEIGNSNADEYEDVTYTAKVETNGKNEYAGKIVITGPSDQIFNFLCEGFYVREKNSGVANWTYSTAAYQVIPLIDFATGAISDIEYYPLKKVAGSYEAETTAVSAMSFQNTYTLNKDLKAPQTGDNSSIYLWNAVLLVSVCGVAAATIVSKKRRYEQ